MKGGPAYIVKPKYIFKHPFNKYDLANPSNRQTQNQQLTDYFNYGFNEDTMNIYGKLVKRFIQVLDHHKNLEYFNEPSALMRLNDQIPMDFGGFCKFHDPSIVDNQTPENFHDGENLMRYFIMMIFANASRKVQYPLIQFITKMYKKPEDEDQDTSLFDIIEQICKNLETKYEETMKKIEEKANEVKAPAHKRGHGRDNHKDRQSVKEGRNSSAQRDKGAEKRQDSERKRNDKSRKSKSSRNKSQSQDDSSSSSDESEDRRSKSRRKKARGSESQEKSRKRERSRGKDKDRKKKDRHEKERHKSKKERHEREKSHKRDRSHEKKKKRHH